LKDNVDDFDRNKQVNPNDQLLARANQTTGLNALRLIAVTNPSAAPAPADLALATAVLPGGTAGLPSSVSSADSSSATDGLSTRASSARASVIDPATNALTFALCTPSSGSGSKASSGTAVGLTSSIISHVSDVTAQRPSIASSPNLAQALRQIAREWHDRDDKFQDSGHHDDSHDALDDDLLEVLSRRLSRRN
jgi:hypothetical protein